MKPAGVIDTSVVIEIVMELDGREAMLRTLAEFGHVYMSRVSAYEASTVVLHRHGPQGLEKLDRLFELLQVTFVDFSAEQQRLSTGAYLRFGKGRHRAALNLGDCPSYALAISSRLPLVYKGDDFCHTDLPLLVAPVARR